MNYYLSFFISLLLWGTTASSQNGNSPGEDIPDEILEARFDSVFEVKKDSIHNSLNYQGGIVPIENGLATLTVPDGFKFLGPEQSKFVLTALWGNPPSNCLGILFKKDEGPLSSNLTFAVEIVFSPIGFVKETESQNLDPNALFSALEEEVEYQNISLDEKGYQKVSLKKWTSPPAYDYNKHLLHWGREIIFEGEESGILNYDIRILGKGGTMNLNIISDIGNLSRVNEDLPALFDCLSFSNGNRYEDYVEGVDSLSGLNPTGLIVGHNLPPKRGFGIPGLDILLLILGSGTLFYLIKRFFFRKNEDS